MEGLQKFALLIMFSMFILLTIVTAMFFGLDNPFSIVLLVGGIVLALAGFVACSKAIDEA